MAPKIKITPRLVTKSDDVLSPSGKIADLVERIENGLTQRRICGDDEQCRLLDGRIKELSQEYRALTGKHYVTSNKRSDSKY